MRYNRIEITRGENGWSILVCFPIEPYSRTYVAETADRLVAIIRELSEGTR